MANKRRNTSKFNKDKLANPDKTNSSVDAHIKQLTAEAVDKRSVENEKGLKLLKIFMAIIKKELTEANSQGFISARHENLKLDTISY